MMSEWALSKNGFFCPLDKMHKEKKKGPRAYLAANDRVQNDKSPSVVEVSMPVACH